MQLRKQANKLGVIVHGSIYIIDIMVDTGLITRREAVEALKMLMDANDRLPKYEI